MVMGHLSQCSNLLFQNVRCRLNRWAIWVLQEATSPPPRADGQVKQLQLHRIRELHLVEIGHSIIVDGQIRFGIRCIGTDATVRRSVVTNPPRKWSAEQRGVTCGESDLYASRLRAEKGANKRLRS